MSRKLLLGTRNPARIEMLRKILQNTPIRALTLDDIGIDQEVEEDGLSTAANAEKKARFYYALSAIPTLAIDGGLRIDRFPPEKQPGTMVKRISSTGAPTNEALMRYYLRELEMVGGESPGTWTASQALALSANQVLVYSYQFAVRFTSIPCGELAPGRILDSLMVDPRSGKYYTELPLEERPYYQEMCDFVLGNLDKI